MRKLFEGRLSIAGYNKKVDNLLDEYGSDYCLDVGSGKNDDAKWQTVDIDGSSNPTFTGDIRALFAPCPTYRDMLSDFPELQLISQGAFVLVRLQNVAEHIEWLYQGQLMQWVYSLLAPGGVIAIETPNLEYIAKAYLVGLDRVKSGKRPKFPHNEYPDMVDGDSYDFSRWVQFKLFSGCGTGDYHHACYDKNFLHTTLTGASFVNIKIVNKEILLVIAEKAVIEQDGGMDSIISRLK